MLAPDFLLYVGLFLAFRISSCNARDTFLRSGNLPAVRAELSCAQEIILQLCYHPHKKGYCYESKKKCEQIIKHC